MSDETTELRRVLDESLLCSVEMARASEALRDPDSELVKLDPELAKVLADGNARMAKTHADAARLLREVARDFDEYADHGLNGRGENCERGGLGKRCDCGLDDARDRWRLP